MIAPTVELAMSGQAPPAAAPVTVVAMGTSLTARGGWTGPLAATLTARGFGPVRVLAVALPGATSRWVADQAGAASALHPAVVLVEAVVNDPALHRRVSLVESRANVRRLFRALRGAVPRPAVVMLVMNPVAGWRRWVRPGLDAYVDAQCAEARAAGVRVVNLRPRWAGQPRDAIPDGLHPDPAVAGRVIAPYLADVVAQELKGQGR